MLSEFLCECHGRLFSTSELETKYATAVITPGKNDDGWWTANDLLLQIREAALPMFEELHPNCVGIFLCDMNLGSGGNQSKLRNGWFEKNDVRVVQEMVYSPACADLSMAGQAKGIKTVLKERGLWDDGFKLPRARGFLSQQPDFLEQKSMVKELFATTDHRAIFYPSFTASSTSSRCIGGDQILLSCQLQLHICFAPSNSSQGNGTCNTGYYSSVCSEMLAIYGCVSARFAHGSCRMGSEAATLS